MEEKLKNIERKRVIRNCFTDTSGEKRREDNAKAAEEAAAETAAVEEAQDMRLTVIFSRTCASKRVFKKLNLQCSCFLPQFQTTQHLNILDTIRNISTQEQSPNNGRPPKRRNNSHN